MLLTGSQTAGRVEKFGVALAGAIDGVNTVFTSPDDFDPGTLRLYYNGARIYAGAGDDFTVTGLSEITTLFTPLVGDRLDADYVVD